MRHLSTLATIWLLLASSLLTPTVYADCPGNLLFNAGFEEGSYTTEPLGTSLSSSLGNGWLPWSVLGGATYNREVEYKVLDAETLPSRYHLHSGSSSQKFFTTWGTHTAGFFQRVKVIPESQVTFSIWVQIYTGERELRSGGEFISDLESPKPGKHDKGPGLYRASVGIDPYGDVPPGFGASPSAGAIWSAPVTDHETRATDASGHLIDAWVRLSVSALARSEYVTVYTKGQPEYPVKHNDSFWDDACLVMQLPPTATPTETHSPTTTPTRTTTRSPTWTLEPTHTPQPTSTREPSPLPKVPTQTPTPTAIAATATSTTQPTIRVATQTVPLPTPSRAPSPETTAPPTVPLSSTVGLLLIYVGAALLVVAVVLWLRMEHKD